MSGNIEEMLRPGNGQVVPGEQNGHGEAEQLGYPIAVVGPGEPEPLGYPEVVHLLPVEEGITVDLPPIIQ